MKMTTQMHNPPHPGLTIREDVLPALGLKITQAAKMLGVSRVTLSRVLNGRASISAEMALRLERWLAAEGDGSSAESWLRQQTAYDLWQAHKRTRKSLSRVRPAQAATSPADRRKAA
jgi:antitoxin HigA-1